MGPTCILTDSTVQFSKPSFPGRNQVSIIPLRVQYGTRLGAENGEIKVSNLPSSLLTGVRPKLIIPSVEELRQILLNLAQEYREIIAICHSSHLSPLYTNIQEAGQSVSGRITLQIIDSQTLSVGLGILVQAAAEGISSRIHEDDIEKSIRGLIPHIYSILCVPGLTYLEQDGFIGPAQAIIGEMLSLLPIYTLEEGHLSPLEKVRNNRHLLDYFQEFLDEFNELHHIAFLQSTPPMTHEARSLREHASSNFPRTPFSEHPINLPLATMLGPHTIGLIVVEIPSSRMR